MHLKKSTKASFRDILQNRNYSFLWAGQTVSQIGDALTIVAIPLLVYSVGHSALSLTLSFIIESLPWIVIGPIAGVIIDRIERRNVLIAADLLRAFLIIAIFFFPTIPFIYVMSFLSQTLAAIFAPARSTAIPELISKEYYVKAISLSHSSYQVVQIVGPFIAVGIITLLGGPRTALLVDTATFLIAAMMSWRIVFPARTLPSTEPEKRIPFFQSFMEGASFLFKNNILRYATSINILKSVTQAVVLLGSILYVKTEMGLSPATSNSIYGIVVTAIGVGVVIGTALIGLYLHDWNRRGLIAGGLMLQGVAFLLLFFHPGVVLTILIFGVSGFGASGAITPNSAFFAEATPKDLRGRVYSFVNSVLQVAQILGYALVGFVVNISSSILLFLAGGIVLIIVAPLLSLAFRRIDEDRKKEK